MTSRSGTYKSVVLLLSRCSLNEQLRPPAQLPPQFVLFAFFGSILIAGSY